MLSRVGPGAFFALFGALVVGLSLYHGVLLERINGEAVMGEARSASPSPRTERFTGMGAPAAGIDARADARALLRRDIAVLNNFLPMLRADLPPQDRTQVELAIPRIKFALMEPQWPQSAAGWGDRVVSRPGYKPPPRNRHPMRLRPPSPISAMAHRRRGHERRAAGHGLADDAGWPVGP